MSAEKPPMSAAQLIARAEGELTQGAPAGNVVACALLAIAKQGEPTEVAMPLEEYERQRTVHVVTNTATGALIAIHATPESAARLVNGRGNLEATSWLVLP